MIPIRVPWTRQPPAGTPIRRDGLADGLIFFGHFGRNGLPFEECVNEKQGGIHDINSLRSVVKDGMWVGEFPLNSTNGGCDFQPHSVAHSGHLQLTAMCYARNKKTVATSQESCFAYAGSDNDAWDCNLNTSGDWRFRIDIATVIQTGPLVNGLDPASGGADPQQWNMLGGTWSNQLITGRVNRIKGPATATDAGGITAGTAGNNNPRIGAQTSGSTASWDGWVAWGAIWTRDIGDEAWNALVDNPWLLFEPRVIWIPEGGAILPADPRRRFRNRLGFRYG